MSANVAGAALYATGCVEKVLVFYYICGSLARRQMEIRFIFHVMEMLRGNGIAVYAKATVIMFRIALEGICLAVLI